MFYETKAGDTVCIILTKTETQFADITSTTERYVHIGKSKYSRKTGKEHGHMFRRISKPDENSITKASAKLPKSSPNFKR
jgi:hypothetical protein